MSVKHEIQVERRSGRLLGVVCEDNNKKHFVTPVGLFIDDKKDILRVVEMRKNKISVLEILQ